MTEEERWLKVRQIVREENTNLLAQIETLLASAGKTKPKVEFINGRFTGVTDQQMQAWKDAYPAVEIDSELKKMAAWIVSNPMMAPAKLVGRFVNAWLAKEQNRASIRSIPSSPRPVVTPSLCEYCRAPSVGAFEGRRACEAHWQDAVNRVKPRQFMPGVVAKAVAPD